MSWEVIPFVPQLQLKKHILKLKEKYIRLTKKTKPIMNISCNKNTADIQIKLKKNRNY